MKKNYLFFNGATKIKNKQTNKQQKSNKITQYGALLYKVSDFLLLHQLLVGLALISLS